MELKYILTIIGVSIFLIMFLVFVIFTSRSRKREAMLMESLEKMYADKNLAKMDYDFAVYDGELEKILAKRQMPDGQLTIDDFMDSSAPNPVDSVFQTVDTEGVEEIQGTYKPE